MGKLSLACVVVLGFAAFSHAQIVITEVDPSGSASTSGTGGTSNGYTSDWFELTNRGSSAVDITGWTMDDNSHGFATSVPISGITSIGAGQTVVFIDASAAADVPTLFANFKTAWFGANVPAGFTIASYAGSGVGLSQSGDEVNIFNSTGTRITGVGFGASALGVSLDNSANVGGTSDPLPLISTSSVAGVNGAFVAPTGEIGSPGTVPAAVPEPASLGLVGLGSLAVMVRRRRAR